MLICINHHNFYRELLWLLHKPALGHLVWWEDRDTLIDDTDQENTFNPQDCMIFYEGLFVCLQAYKAYTSCIRYNERL